MSAQRYRRTPLSEFLMEVSNLAPVVSRHGKRLGIASQGRINAGTAEEMRRIAEEVCRLNTERRLFVIPSTRDVVDAARAITSDIRVAAKYLAARDAKFAEKFDRTTGTGPRRRSTAEVAFALEMLVGLLREHEDAFAALLPNQTAARAERVLSELREREAIVRKTTETSVAITARRDALIASLDVIVRDVLSLAAVVFRGEPAVEAEFKRCRQRRRQATAERSRRSKSNDAHSTE
jgi:hypothetical protein